MIDAPASTIDRGNMALPKRASKAAIGNPTRGLKTHTLRAKLRLRAIHIDSAPLIVNLTMTVEITSCRA